MCFCVKTGAFFMLFQKKRVFLVPLRTKFHTVYKKTHTHPTWNEYLTIILWKYMCLLVILLYFCHKQSCLYWRLPHCNEKPDQGQQKRNNVLDIVCYRVFFLFCVDKILFMENNIKQEFCRGWFMQTCIMPAHSPLFCIKCHRKWCMVHVINLLLLLNNFF